ncbi:MFS transporter [Noviherbaspirillum sp. DKR-6]|uniref:MFS transporter n=2 Tax=Noviherbaspirillum pedocola TaxID=2801341 RepID=A0A934SZG7_9BURK|nr:MFS transporter [Noviherbaspirillum pedocola]
MAAYNRKQRSSMHNKSTLVLLNVGHAIDHMFLLIFATAATTIAADFGLTRWEDLMPYSAVAFFLFGIGSLPSGKLGDHWGRRTLMIVFFFGMGASAILASLAQSPLQLACALALLGCFASIYHPVGIPMLVQGAERPGWTIGVNGMVGNLGIALAAVLTGLLVKHFGWRPAFAVPGVLSIVCGVAFTIVAKSESTPPAKRAATQSELPRGLLARVFLVMTLAATSGSLLFNFSTNGNYELLHERFAAVTRDPATLGLLLAAIYTVASLAQLVVGRLLDRYPLKKLYLTVLAMQIPFLAMAAHAESWWLYLLQGMFMIAIFGAIPFTDAMIVRYVDDRMRSRVAGMRLAVSFGASSSAVWLLGPLVKQAGFSVLLWMMAGIAALTFTIVTWLPTQGHNA